MTKLVNPPLPTRTRGTARKLRTTMTDAERVLWFRLRGGRLAGLKFRRQHPLPPFVVDFHCHEAGLVVELDGSQHGADVDQARTRAIEKQGFRILRFWDNQILQQLDDVLAEIIRVARARTLTRRCAPPSPGGRGAGNKETRR
ncbi:MAG: endonuclease domain-containing protein [Proteobacteria bacterium]|nr:endonuclease domain-containing protein [Pseudomonadota bacterium]